MTDSYEPKRISRESIPMALQKAELRRPAGNDEAMLRWNTCARILARDEHIRPRVEESVRPGSE